jgi:transposase
MLTTYHAPQSQPSIRTDLGAIFVSLELSRKMWLITSLSPGVTKMSKHAIAGSDMRALVQQFTRLQAKAEQRSGKIFPLIVIQEAGLDGFWIHRLLENEGIESHVVDPASIAVSRRARRAKTDKIDGETLVRTLMAFKRGEPRICAMVTVPSPEEEDRRRIARERSILIKERVEHGNRIKGLLFCQGISNYEPLRGDRRQRLETLQTGDGRPLPDCLKRQITRELDRLEFLLDQIKTVEAERDSLMTSGDAPSPALLLSRLKSIGPEIASVLWVEGLYRTFKNRRQLAAYAGLAPTPWQSGAVQREQGISQAGNPRLRNTMIELAWLWLRHQPQSALSRWFLDRVKSERGRVRRINIVGLARKLLIALWRYTTHGEVPKDAELKAA